MQSQGPYEIDDSPDRVDLDAAWQFLSAEAYWGRWHSRDDVQRQIQGAWRVVGCNAGLGHMVESARALSDGVALAYSPTYTSWKVTADAGLAGPSCGKWSKAGRGKNSGGCCTPPIRTASTGNSASPPRTLCSRNAPAGGPRQLIRRRPSR